MTWRTVVLWPGCGRGCGCGRQKGLFTTICKHIVVALAAIRCPSRNRCRDRNWPSEIVDIYLSLPRSQPQFSHTHSHPIPALIPSRPFSYTHTSSSLMATKAAYKRVRLLLLLLLPLIHLSHRISYRRNILPCRGSHPLSSGLHPKRKTF